MKIEGLLCLQDKSQIQHVLHELVRSLELAQLNNVRIHDESGCVYIHTPDTRSEVQWLKNLPGITALILIETPEALNWPRLWSYSNAVYCKDHIVTKWRYKAIPIIAPPSEAFSVMYTVMVQGQEIIALCTEANEEELCAWLTEFLAQLLG